MGIQWLVGLLSSEFYKNFIITYTATGVLDALKNKIMSKKELPLDLQVIECLAKSLEDTCNLLAWEYDESALKDVVLIPLMNIEEDFTKERLAKILQDFAGQSVSDDALDQWVKCFLINLSSNSFTHLREYLKLKNLFLKEGRTSHISRTVRLDDRREYVNNYVRKLFWSSNSESTLQKLYLANSYYLNQSQTKYDDLGDLITAFTNNNLLEYLNKKNIREFDSPHLLLISGYPGCGKSSLVSKLAYENFMNDEFDQQGFLFINMSKFDSAISSLDDILKRIGIKQDQLKNLILVMDSFDEALKKSANSQAFFSELSDDLYNCGCKGIITCRSNLVNSDNIRNCFEIKLAGFDRDEAKKWLDNYYVINKNLDLDAWFSRIDSLDDGLINIVLIPLILYICVERDIDIGNIHNLGQLYDLLFDPLHGQVAITRHRDRTSHRNLEWLELRALAKKISIIMYQKGWASREEIIEASGNEECLEKYFGLDFYIENASEQIKFVHTSIWQYFVAERIYESLVKYEREHDLNNFLDDLAEIFVLDKTLDDTVMFFLAYLFDKNSWKPESNEIYKSALIRLADYRIKKEGDVFSWIACFWRELFKIYTIMCKKFFPQSALAFFHEVSTSEKKEILIRYSNSSQISPIINVKGYSLMGCNLDRINFSHTNMKGCVMRKSFFRNAIFCKAIMQGAYADHSNFVGTDFSGADLKNIDFTEAVLSECNFSCSRLDGANLSFANLERADLRKARIVKVQLTGTKLNNCIIDISQMWHIGLENIFEYNIHVYDQEERLTSELIKLKYKEQYPVSYAFWSREPF